MNRTYQPLTANLLAELAHLFPQTLIWEDKELLFNHSHDETENLSYLPAAVFIPKTTTELQTLVKWAAKNKIPLTTQGARTGLAGGALPVAGGIAVSMEKMNSIIAIDADNFQITVEAGLITGEINRTIKDLGLFYPAEPSSKDSSFIGGNVATNAGGARAVKYGVTRDYVLNLEVILPNGELIWTGANTLKNSTGYNLTQLIAGSEGTLAIITKVVLKLVALPTHRLVLWAEFDDILEAGKAVTSVFKGGLLPAAIEFMEKEAVEVGIAYLNHNPTGKKLDKAAYLLIELDGNQPEVLQKDAETLFEILQQHQVGEILYADNAQQQEELWKLRRCIGHAVKISSIYKEEDTVVPRAQLPALIVFIKNLAQQHNFKAICYGHAGDGNLHVNILRGNLSQTFWEEELPQLISVLFEYVKQLGGTISGEHGIGWVQKKYLSIVCSPAHIELLKMVKKAFDPEGILNPNKIF